MRVDIVTWPELEAQALMQRSRGYVSNQGPSAHEDADAIIALAERIKASRATVAMVEAATAASHLSHHDIVGGSA